MTDETDPLEVAAWTMVTGGLASEDLPEIATEALVRGLDSPALRVLAGQPRDDVRDSAELFRVALDELGIDLPDADTRAVAPGQANRGRHCGRTNRALPRCHRTVAGVSEGAGQRGPADLCGRGVNAGRSPRRR